MTTLLLEHLPEILIQLVVEMSLLELMPVMVKLVQISFIFLVEFRAVLITSLQVISLPAIFP